MDDVEWRVSPTLVEYPAAVTQMQQRVKEIQQATASELIWLLEHPPLYTAGTSAKAGDLLTPDRFPVYASGRGGQYTYHGPGQRVVYAMLDLKRRMQPGPDLRRYVWLMEEWAIRSIAPFGITGERREGRIGIWVVDAQGREAKIAAIGIRVQKWVSFHGLCINVQPNLAHYAGIIPCGIQQHGVTSIAQILQRDVTMAELNAALKQCFAELAF